MKNISAAQFEELFLQDTHWIDVRAPIEYTNGSIPGAINLPLLIDEERRLVGIAYKEQGSPSAIQLGHQLVSGSIRQTRISSWQNEIEKNPSAIIYCYRGGLRSQITQTWLAEKEIHRPIVTGGYKALRNFLLEILSLRTSSLEFCVVSGPTGSGKTKYLHKSGQPFLDLEAIANHRGSAFGALPTPQPSQADFENRLAVQILKLSQLKKPILIESESRMIGHRYITDTIFDKIKSSPRIFLEVSLDERVENIFQDYVVNSSLQDLNNIERFNEFRNSVKVITRKLGHQRAQEILNDIDYSQNEFTSGSGLSSNKIWIRKLLNWYYDPLYKGLY